MNQPSYETVKPEALRPGDVIFLARADREVVSVLWDPSFAFPGGPEPARPAYLLEIKGWRGIKAYRPDATVTRRKRSETAA